VVQAASSSLFVGGAWLLARRLVMLSLISPTCAQNSPLRPRLSSEVEHVVPFGFDEDVLDHQRVDVDERGPQDVQGEHPELLFVAAVGGELAALWGSPGFGQLDLHERTADLPAPARWTVVN